MKRKMFTLFVMFASVAALGFGCELGDGADADSANTTQNDMPNVTPDSNTTPDTVTNTPDYRFVRIDDLSTDSDKPDSGADIDSIILEKNDGSKFYGENVEDFAHGGGFADELDPTEALGAPDAFFDYPNTDECDVEGGFVSLGGVGGFVIVRMGAKIETNDTLSVLEVGGCDFDGGTARVEEAEVSISVTSDRNGTWKVLGTGEGPEVTFTIPTL